MDTIKEITSRTKTETDWYLAADDTEDPEFETITDLDSKRLEELAAKYGVSTDFLFELNSLFESFRDAVHKDLSDIWERLDEKE